MHLLFILSFSASLGSYVIQYAPRTCAVPLNRRMDFVSVCVFMRLPVNREESQSQRIHMEWNAMQTMINECVCERESFRLRILAQLAVRKHSFRFFFTFM